MLVRSADQHDWSHKILRFFWWRLERRKAKLLESFEGWHPDWLVYRPSGKSWSVLQVLEHLAQSERALRIQGLRALEQMPEIPRLGERMSFFLFLVLLRLPIRLNVPRQLSFVQPGSPQSLSEVKERWQYERLLLAQFLLPRSNRELRQVAFRHPAVGAISLRDAVSFLLVHMSHHSYQLHRLRREVTHAFL
jgi:uncharacterized damage-inducible protein DinB